MGDKAQQYKDAAQALGKNQLINAFGATAGTGLAAFENDFNSEETIQGYAGRARDVVHNLMAAGQAKSRINTNSGSNKRDDKNQEQEKEKRFWEKVRIQQALQQYLKALDDRIEELNNLINPLRIEVAQNNRKLSEFEEDLKAINQFRQAYDNGEDIEVNSDGTLRHKRWEKLLKQYEERTGEKIDRKDSSSIFKALVQEQEKIEENKINLKNENDKKIIELEKLEKEQKNLLDEKKRVEEKISVAVEKDDPASLEKTIQEAPAEIKQSLLRQSDLPKELKEKLEEKMNITEAEKTKAINFSFGDPKKVFAEAASGEGKVQNDQNLEVSQDRSLKAPAIN